MALSARKRGRPAITMTDSDHEALSKLAEALVRRNAAPGQELLVELDRANVVSDTAIAGNTIRMESRVRYVTEDGKEREVELSYPGKADIASGSISILTPIGVALIGLKAGQSIDWSTPDGRIHRLTVLEVRHAGQPALS